MKFHFRTYGCKVNWLDTARLSAALQMVGHQPVKSEAEADVIFINSCTVTAEADRKAHQAVSSASRQAAEVAVLGCSPRVDPQPWQGKSQHIFQDEGALLSAYGVKSEELPFPLNSRTRLPLAIQMGCDDHCTFCITRIARGAHRNIPADELIRQLHTASEQGVKEVILTGINLAAWGCESSTRPEQSRLGELLQRMLNESDIPRIRLSSLGPQYLHPAFFDALSDPRICAHVHLSVQSGSDSLLSSMQRGHNAEQVYRVAELARKQRADVALATDLIAGFPGEGLQEFDQTVSMVESIRFAKLHVFPYSPREGTASAKLSETVTPSEKKSRTSLLRDLGRKHRDAFIESQLDSRQSVLTEAGGKGLTGNYIRIHVLQGKQGEIRPVELKRAMIAEPGWK